jgi:Cu/Zn superoxide dismutase
MKPNSVAVMLSATVLVTGAAFAQAPKMDPMKSDAKTMTVPITAQNNSGLKGTATFTPEGDKTRVVLQLSGDASSTPMPAHIHDGTCAKIDAKPKWPLENVVNGRSTTLVSASVDAILKGDTAINVHKSAADMKTYVACGDLK